MAWLAYFLKYIIAITIPHLSYTPRGGLILRPMTNYPTSSPPADDEREDAEARRRWRRVGRLFSEIVETRVNALGNNQQADNKENTDEAQVRKISALVIAAQRSMEMEDRYERKESAGKPKSGRDEDWRARARALLGKTEAELEDMLRDKLLADKKGADPCAGGGQ